MDSNISEDLNSSDYLENDDSDSDNDYLCQNTVEKLISPLSNIHLKFMPKEGLNNKAKRNITTNDFDQLHFLGEGTVGTVILVRHKLTELLFTQKRLKKSSLCVIKKLKRTNNT